MTIEEFNQTSFCAGDRFKYHGEWHNVASLNLAEALLAYDTSEDDDEDMQLSWLRCESIEEFMSYQDIMEAQHLPPGMLTYDDGRTYSEQCREVMEYKGPRDGEAVDAEAMKRYLDNIK